jgi:hypothetical protein
MPEGLPAPEQRQVERDRQPLADIPTFPAAQGDGDLPVLQGQPDDHGDGLNEPLASEKATPEEEEVLAWVRAANRNGIVTANDSLKQLITLTTAILGGSVALTGQIGMPWWAKAFGCGPLLLALLVALFGNLPYPIDLNPDVVDTEAVRGRRLLALRVKVSCLWTSTGLLAFALVVLVTGMVYG